MSEATTTQTPTTSNGLVACRVRRFAQRHSYGPHPPGAIVHVEPAELKTLAVKNALITLEEEERLRRAEEEKVRMETEDRIAAFESDRASVIASQRSVKEAEELRAATTRPGPATGPAAAAGARGGRGRFSPKAGTRPDDPGPDDQGPEE